MPFSGFLLRNQAPTTQGDDTKAPPRPHPHQQQQQQGVVTEEPSARKLASRQPPQLISQMKKPKLSVGHIEVKKNPQHVEKQRGNLLLDNSEQSSGGELEWSDSDEGDLVMDTPSAAVAQANLKKKVPRKTKKAVVKSEDPVCGGDDGEGKDLGIIHHHLTPPRPSLTPLHPPFPPPTPPHPSPTPLHPTLPPTPPHPSPPHIESLAHQSHPEPSLSPPALAPLVLATPSTCDVYR